MVILKSENSLGKEFQRLYKQETKFLKAKEEKKEGFLNQKLAQVVPDKLQKTLDDAFSKAFALIFEKGTGFIEKTYRREEMEKNYQINEFTDNVKKSSKSLKAFSKSAKSSKTGNVLLSGVSGIGMGALGVGLPDIPIFTGMILKSIYEIALSYGFEYESEKEQYFILRLIQTAVSNGDALKELNQEVDRYIHNESLPEHYEQAQQIAETAGMLSKELLYMKFLQGIPFVGVIGGAFDAIYMKQITEYAELKYRRRFLLKKKNR
uniref:EcsC family protein n=1 Tax=Acetatifactor sp. TaxID=1872090 RepID=UPI0040575666